MNYFTLHDFDKEMLTAFIAFATLEGDKTLLVDSNGGYTKIKDALVYIINNSNIDVVVYGQAHSAAFDMLFELNRKPKILQSAYSAVHLSSWSLESRDLLSSSSYGSFCKDTSVEMQAEELLKYKPYLSSEQLSLLKSGETVYLNAKALKRIFNE